MSAFYESDRDIKFPQSFVEMDEKVVFTWSYILNLWVSEIRKKWNGLLRINALLHISKKKNYFNL